MIPSLNSISKGGGGLSEDYGEWEHDRNRPGYRGTHARLPLSLGRVRRIGPARELLSIVGSRSSWAGGIGSALLLFSAAGGVGRITAMDRDDADASDLRRQVVHTRGEEGNEQNNSFRA